MPGLLDGFLSRLMRQGNLAVTNAAGRTIALGDGTGPQIAVRIVDAAAERALLRNPELTLGELYMNGRIVFSSGTIYDLVEMGLRNIASAKATSWVSTLARLRTSMRRIRQHNTLRRARSNVAHHYDIDSRLYSLFLDADRQYSCAYFEAPDESLDDAQRGKKRHVAAKLLVEPGHKVLDIGCGWGGLALYLATVTDARVTGITLSAEQLAMGRERVAAQGLSRQVDLRLSDYRDLNETFDRIVSVGMFEHVGIAYYDTYFQTIARCLEADGVALVHTIGRTGQAGATSPWIEKYIFPGGYIPAMSEVLPAIERAGLIVTDVEILRLHYAETLKAWRDRFMANRAAAAALYDERFCRMWEFYLAASEAVFRIGGDVVFQFQLAKRVDSVPITRDYIAAREHALRLRDSGPTDEIRMAGE